MILFKKIHCPNIDISYLKYVTLIIKILVDNYYYIWINILFTNSVLDKIFIKYQTSYTYVIVLTSYTMITSNLDLYAIN